jgi:chromosome segregation ATPase
VTKRGEGLDSTLRRLTNECKAKKQLAAELDKKIKAIQEKINGGRESESVCEERFNQLKEEIRHLQTAIAQQRQAMLDPLEQRIKEKRKEKLNLKCNIEELNAYKLDQEAKKAAEKQLQEETERLNDAFKVAAELKKKKMTIEAFVNKFPQKTRGTIPPASTSDSMEEKVNLLCQIKPIVEQMLGQKL